MDLSAALAFQKQTKEKRERQPNWTEPEKQLLISLTGMHQSILENKGSDTMTLKRKSEAWDQIALDMQAAGYNRSKDRLKQQLVRIRATEAKKIKDAMDKDLIAVQEGNCFQCVVNNNLSLDEKVTSAMEECYKNESVGQVLPTLQIISLPLEDLQIKAERKLWKDNGELMQQQQKQDKHLSTANVPDKEIETSSNMVIEDITADFTPITNSTLTTNLSASTTNIQQQRKGRIRRMQVPRIRAPSIREQRLREIYSLRVAFERKRLHSLHIQQKRDRVLYRKDLQIQNLKLQILRNMANQNPDGNNINI